MDMKTHLLTALREQLERWEDLLAMLSESQLTAPLLPWHWSPKDVLAHLAAWQQISTARVEAALADREPQFPAWLPGAEPGCGRDARADQRPDLCHPPRPALDNGAAQLAHRLPAPVGRQPSGRPRETCWIPGATPGWRGARW